MLVYRRVSNGCFQCFKQIMSKCISGLGKPSSWGAVHPDVLDIPPFMDYLASPALLLAFDLFETKSSYCFTLVTYDNIHLLYIHIYICCIWIRPCPSFHLFPFVLPCPYYFPINSLFPQYFPIYFPIVSPLCPCYFHIISQLFPHWFPSISKWCLYYVPIIYLYVCMISLFISLLFPHYVLMFSILFPNYFPISSLVFPNDVPMSPLFIYIYIYYIYMCIYIYIFPHGFHMISLLFLQNFPIMSLLSLVFPYYFPVISLLFHYSFPLTLRKNRAWIVAWKTSQSSRGKSCGEIPWNGKTWEDPWESGLHGGL